MTGTGDGGGERETATAKRLFGRAYDDIADGYAGAADRLVFRHTARPLAQALVAAAGGAEALAGRVLLDAAAGTGALGRLLPGRVAALDLSREQLRNNATSLRVRGDTERLPFADDAFAAAGCAFGINHCPDPAAAVAELARVAPVIGLLTWVRPEVPVYRPKQVVAEAIQRYSGRSRTAAGDLVERLGTTVGSAAALHLLLARAGLRVASSELAVEVPWPGTVAFVDYRLRMAGAALPPPDRLDALRQEAVAAVEALPPRDLPWRPALAMAIGWR